jgi:MinD superfamily P-loop ATPase
VEEYCRAENIPVLLTIPLDTDIARLYSRGITLVKGMPQWEKSFVELFEKIQEIVSERNSYTKR